MPEHFDDYRRPEQLLPGSDRPRPLSPVLRARLEQSLLGLAAGKGPTATASPPGAHQVPPPVPKPLSPEVRDRLENSLRPVRPKAARSWRVIVPGAAVAAAIAVLAAIVVPQLVNSPNRPAGVYAAKAAAPSVARFGLGVPPPSTELRGRSPGGKSEALPGGVPGGVPGRPPRGRSAPARLVPTRSGTAPVVPGPVVPGSVVPGSAAPRSAVTGRPATAPGPMAAVVEVPVVSSVSPRQGPPGGGNWVVVTGQGFVGVSAVDFGAAPAAKFTVESPLRLKVRAPAHAPGTVDLVVAGAAGRSNVSALDRYSFGP